MPLGDKVRALRVQRGWTQGQLLVQARRYIPAGKMFARETLSRIENGRNKPDFWIVEALANALGVEITDLVDETQGAALGSDWPADVVTIAERLGELPDETRARAVSAVSGLLDAIEAEIYAGLSAKKRQIVDYFDDLDEADQEAVLQQVLDMLRRAGGDAPSGAQSATK